ncbi:hypothetical protein ACFOKF_15510 [Sphingobium rhizovicinum]|uniref:Uncharacterized protein n=1 Tax=Sphingobium rhizovicinum TaxID=432308 RepID=A0ABV7NIE7_9SPHN
MDEATARRIEHLEAQVHALTQLLLSHIVASDLPVAEEALQIAASQRDSCYTGGLTEAGMLLSDMIGSVAEVLELPYRP